MSEIMSASGQDVVTDFRRNLGILLDRQEDAVLSSVQLVELA